MRGSHPVPGPTLPELPPELVAPLVPDEPPVFLAPPPPDAPPLAAVLAGFVVPPVPVAVEVLVEVLASGVDMRACAQAPGPRDSANAPATRVSCGPPVEDVPRADRQHRGLAVIAERERGMSKPRTAGMYKG